MQTLVDTEVRDTYQLEPSSIEIENPQWNTQLQILVDRVAKGLGCSGKVEAKLYKLLLYKPGGHFKKHRDTEKDKNMFGTLILQLPSIHEGGDLVVHNRDNTHTVFDFGKSTNRSAYGIHFAAHYADAEHEVTEIKSGYRLALVYSLCWVEGHGQTVFKSELIEQLKEPLAKVKDKTIAVMLSHRYTQQSFRQNGIKALKGIDNDRYSLLNAANLRLPKKNQFEFRIASATLKIGCDHMLGNEDTTPDSNTFKTNKWFDSKGCSKKGLDLTNLSYVIDPERKKVVSNEEFNDERLFGTTDFLEWIQGYLGNESVYRVTLYRRYFLAMLPKISKNA